MLYGARVYKLLEGLLLYRTDSHQTIAAQLQAHAGRQPDQVFLYYGGRSYTYGEANAQVNRHCAAYRALGVGEGDVVALLLENRPEFLWHMYALHKLGAISSLVNTHLQAAALAHAVRICAPKHIVVGSEVWSQFAPVIDLVGPTAREMLDVDVDPEDPEVPEAPLWSERLHGTSDANPDVPGPTLRAQAAFIYTSGTTGLPKAAIVRHDRFFRAGRIWATIAFRFKRGDVLYNCLPLYHSNSVLLATGSVVTAGASMALVRKFSRTRFWDDVRKYNATQFIYIGELCRYLLNNPPSPNDRDHRIRSISGNGLRREIWEDFKQRFGIPRVAEFYAATEGNCITLNFLNLVGSVGPRLPGMALVQWDESAQDFRRDAQGQLQRVRNGEPGILLGKIRRRARFEGYHDKAASEQKILRDVFQPGDAWFNTGDLLRRDQRAHLYFVDRVGDTFRWKGENVATSEVQAHLAQWPEVEEASVYGVTIPGTEGRAGMAALVLRNGEPFDPDAFRDHATAGLAAYARPLFVRLRKELQKTSTLKLQKNELQKEGYDPRQITDPLYFFDAKSGKYVSITPEIYDSIAHGQLAL
ncbi:MAG TPA: long-chain-acyl-CoA synthetase [Polyangiales bacterium]|nr:long-chain-acyl-CoA synthetase [Polyangiales bacterium]